MTIYEYGNPDADTVLIQLTGDHELSVLKNEVEEIRKRTSTDFRLIAAKVDDWNYELSPWKAPAVFGNEDFGDGAVRTLEQILTLCTDKSRTYYIGGYSLAGLFSLWAAYQTDVFSGIAAASPSVWFPGFIEYTTTPVTQNQKWAKMCIMAKSITVEVARCTPMYFESSIIR